MTFVLERNRIIVQNGQVGDDMVPCSCSPPKLLSFTVNDLLSTTPSTRHQNRLFADGMVLETQSFTIYEFKTKSPKYPYLRIRREGYVTSKTH
jgi:hypothetical protein